MNVDNNVGKKKRKEKCKLVVNKDKEMKYVKFLKSQQFRKKEKN